MTIDPQFIIDTCRFDNQLYIASRIAVVPPKSQGSLQTALSYLYLTEGPINLPKDRLRIAEPYLELSEKIVAQWLCTRTNGSERKNYGKNALKAARSAHYRCQLCGFSDVRVLNLDHVEGRTLSNNSFACLCANCHTIKSREKDWTGKKRS